MAMDMKEALVRFGENEERVNIFVNDPERQGYYTTATPEKQVETLPHLIERVGKTTDLILNNTFLESGVFNVRKDMTITRDMPAGSIVELPASYYHGRNTLYITYENLVCTPAWVGFSNKYQYE